MVAGNYLDPFFYCSSEIPDSPGPHLSSPLQVSSGSGSQNSQNSPINPKPETLNPKPYTLNLNPKP